MMHFPEIGGKHYSINVNVAIVFIICADTVSGLKKYKWLLNKVLKQLFPVPFWFFDIIIVRIIFEDTDYQLIYDKNETYDATTENSKIVTVKGINGYVGSTKVAKWESFRRNPQMPAHICYF